MCNSGVRNTTGVLSLFSILFMSVSFAFGQERAFKLGDSVISLMAIAPKGNVIAIDTVDVKAAQNLVVLFDITHEKSVDEFRYGKSGPAFRALVFSKDGKSLMVFGGVSSPGATVIKYWDVQTEKVTKTFEGAGQGIAMTERWLVTRNFPDCKTVRVFDLEMGKQVAVLTDFPSRVEKAAISQDGKYLALLEDQGPLKIWELPGGKELLKWNYQSVSALLFFKNEPTLAILRGGGGLAIYDLKTGKGTGPGFFNARAVSDDGKLMAMKGEVVYGEKKGTIKRYPDAVHILSREKRQIIASFNTEPKWEVRQLQFTPDGRYLLAAGGAGIVRLWDVSKLER